MPEAEQQEQLHPSLARSFGEGELPAELYRFNWGAFLLPVVWGVVYGSWQIVGVWALALLIPLILATAVEGTAGLLANVVLVTVASEVISGLARLWVGANANRLLWRRDALRLKVLPDAAPRFSLARYRARQRIWAIAGWVIVGIGSVAAIPVMAAMWEEYSLTYVGAAMPLLWLVAEVLLALWLDSRMRTEAPDSREAADSRA